MDIDAVVAWVDGSDPVHEAKRLRYAGEGPVAPSANASKARRFSDNDEIRYCLRSIRNYAPWIRRIWLVTDAQFPPSIDVEAAATEGIHVVDHRTVFRGLTALLPTFNSSAIETLLFRIPDLADHFLYFNDDMFLTRAVEPGDFFRQDKVVLRGTWLSVAEDAKMHPHPIRRLNAARMLGFTAERHYGAAHVIYPMQRKVMKKLYRSFGPEFVRNAAFRFRSKDQWNAISLHNHYLFQQELAIEGRRKQLVHLSVASCQNDDAETLTAQLDRMASPKTFAGCINYMEAVADKVPDVRERLEQLTGPARAFERSLPPGKDVPAEPPPAG